MNCITEINITDYDEADSGVMIINLTEFMKKYVHRLSKPHRLAYFQIYFIMDGAGKIGIDGNSYNYKAPVILTVSKGQIQTIESYHNLNGYVLNISEEILNQHPGDITWLNNLMIFNRSGQPVLLKVVSNELKEITALVNTIHSEFRSNSLINRNEILSHLIKSVLLFIERNKGSNQKNNNVDARYNYFIEFEQKLENNYCFNRAVKFYSDVLNLTPRTLNQISVKYSGKSAKRVIEERVLLEVKRLLLYTDNSIKEIGFALGFTDPTNFNKFFKKYESVTPSTYREIKKNSFFDHKRALNNH